MNCVKCGNEIVGSTIELKLSSEMKERKIYKCFNCDNEIDPIAAHKDYTKLHPGENKFLLRVVNKTKEINMEVK